MSHFVPPAFSRILDTVGDGTGETSGVGDFSTIPRVLKLTPGFGEVFHIEKILITVIAQSAKFKVENYGDIVGGLTKGVKLQRVQNGEVVGDLTASKSVRSNSDWLAYTEKQELHEYGQGGMLSALSIKFDFSIGSIFFKLIGRDRQSVQVVLNDDFSSLTLHEFSMRAFVGDL